MDIYQKRVKLYKAIKKIYRELDKQNIKNSEKPHTVISALFDLQNGNREDIPESIQKLYDDFSDDFAALDIVGNLYSMAGASDGHGLGIVLTPSSVTNLMCDLIDVNADSHVLDLCAGAGAFPVSAINHGANQIKAVELQPSIAKLAFANIGLAGNDFPDVIVDDAFKFDGYGDFGPDRFLCNPPYSYDEKGMPFVLQGLKYMKKSGLCAVIIMSQAGNGAAVKTNQSILKYNTLLCSIKMPDKLFYPSASVGTSIYIFKAGVPHDFNKPVRFISFKDDGFYRSKKSLRAADNPAEKYARVLDLWRSDKTFDDKHNEEVIDDVITDSGDDWNFDKHYEVDLRPKPSYFYKTVADYQDWMRKEYQEDYDRRMMKKLDGELPMDAPDNSEFYNDNMSISWPDYVKQVMSYPEYNNKDKTK